MKKDTDKQINSQSSLGKKLNAFDLFTIGFGAIIGIGWFIVVGDWVNIGGGPLATILAFAVGAICLLPISMLFGKLSVTFPIAGGAVVYAEKAYGRKLSFITGWILCLSYIVICPWEVIAIGQLIETLLPVLKVIKLYSIGNDIIYLPRLIICLLVSGLIFYFNYTGVDKMVKLQKILVIILFFVGVITIIASFVFGQFDHLKPFITSTPMNPKGDFGIGFLSVLAITPFFYAGFDTIAQEAEEVKESADRKRVSAMSYLSVCSAAVFYVLIILSACLVVPWTGILNLELPAADIFLSMDLNIIRLIIIVGAFCGLITTLNSFFVGGARALLSMGREKTIPAMFSKIHSKYSTPVIANLFIGAVTLTGAFLGKSVLIYFTNVGSFGFVFAWLIVGISAVKIKNKNKSIKIPRLLTLIAIILTSIMLLLLIIPGSPGALAWPVEIIILFVWVAMGFAFYFTTSGIKTRKNI